MSLTRIWAYSTGSAIATWELYAVRNTDVAKTQQCCSGRPLVEHIFREHHVSGRIILQPIMVPGAEML
jgi:hypothetical protein